MKLPHLLIVTLFLATSCTSQSTAPASTTTPRPTRTSAPTATVAPTETQSPTETPAPIPTLSDVFGAIPLNSVQAFSIEPIAKAAFEQALQEYVNTDQVKEFRVDRVAVFPSGGGGLIAEIYYSLRAEDDPWVEDFGTAGTDGWITGKCSRFDLVATETEHQLQNKRLCS